MLRKNVSIIGLIVVGMVLAACGSPATSAPAPTQLASTEAAATTAPATSAPTEAPTEVAPSGGMPISGGTPQAEAISAGNLDRLNSFFEIPLKTFMLGLSFSPDNKRVAAATPDGAQIFDLDSQKQVAAFASKIPLTAVVWSPDGKLAVGVPGDPAHGKITIWDMAANAESDLLKSKLDSQVAFAFSPDGTQAASGGASGVVTVWNLPGGDTAATFNVTDAGASTGNGQPVVTGLSFIGDGKTLAVKVGSANSETLLWDLAANKALPKPSLAQHVDAPDATALFAPGDASHIYWWSGRFIIVVDLASDKETGRLTAEDAIQSAAFSPDGKLLAAASAGTQNGAMGPLVKLWDTAAGKEVKVLTGFSQIPIAMAFSPDGSRLALGIATEGISIWGPVQNK